MYLFMYYRYIHALYIKSSYYFTSKTQFSPPLGAMLSPLKMHGLERRERPPDNLCQFRLHLSPARSERTSRDC